MGNHGERQRMAKTAEGRIMKGILTPKEKSALFIIIGYALASGVCNQIDKETIRKIMDKLEEQETATP